MPCTTCGAPGTNKSSCPHNPSVSDECKNYKKHRAVALNAPKGCKGQTIYIAHLITDDDFSVPNPEIIVYSSRDEALKGTIHEYLRELKWTPETGNWGGVYGDAGVRGQHIGQADPVAYLISLIGLEKTEHALSNYTTHYLGWWRNIDPMVVL